MINDFAKECTGSNVFDCLPFIETETLNYIYDELAKEFNVPDEGQKRRFEGSFRSVRAGDWSGDQAQIEIEGDPNETLESSTEAFADIIIYKKTTTIYTTQAI